MKRVNFKLQMLFSSILVIAGFVCSLLLKNDVWYNLAWAVLGVLFFINPVYPENAVPLEQEKAKKGIRIAGIILVFIGLTNGFGV